MIEQSLAKNITNFQPVQPQNPPTNLQPNQPPSAQTPSSAPNNSGAVVTILNKLLKALTDLLGMVSK